jgi:hypothetical protein
MSSDTLYLVALARTDVSENVSSPSSGFHSCVTVELLLIGLCGGKVTDCRPARNETRVLQYAISKFNGRPQFIVSAQTGQELRANPGFWTHFVVLARRVMSAVSLRTPMEPLLIAVNVLLPVMHRRAKRTRDDWFGKVSARELLL